LEEEITHFIPRTGMREGYIYLQLTRGVAERNHRFPKPPTSTLLFYAHTASPIPEPGEGEGIKLLPMPDERWQRCWIKSIGLIANVQAKNEAITLKLARAFRDRVRTETRSHARVAPIANVA